MITVSYLQIPTQYYIPAFTVLLTVFSNEIIKASDFSTVKLGYPISDIRLPYRNIRRYCAEALLGASIYYDNIYICTCHVLFIGYVCNLLLRLISDR